MPELHETLLGRRFLEHDIPEIHEQISQLNKTLKSSGLSEGINRIADALEDKNKMLSRLHEYREVTKLSNKIESLKKFIEETEALTKDPETAERIRNFAVKEGIWKIPILDK